VTDDGLAQLKHLPCLTRLRLRETAISDAGLAILGGLHTLETLDLRGTQITSAGLKHLGGLRNLSSLRIAHSAVLPHGLGDLAKNTDSLWVDIQGLPLTDENVQLLKRTTPSHISIGFSDPKVPRDDRAGHEANSEKSIREQMREGLERARQRQEEEVRKLAEKVKRESTAVPVTSAPDKRDNSHPF
jgi:hypothetical protein